MIDEFEMQKVESSNIDEIGYDETTLKLVVQFKNGGRYTYAGVSPEVFADFATADSQGKFFHKHIRGKYNHEKLPDRVIYVTKSCNHERIDEEEVEMLNISEDEHGRDVVAFECPDCGETHTSLRIG